MNEQAMAIFCICGEVVRSYGFSENPNYKMTTAEVMTFAIIPKNIQKLAFRLCQSLGIELKKWVRIG
jgi:hypothetical protein